MHSWFAFLQFNRNGPLVRTQQLKLSMEFQLYLNLVVAWWSEAVSIVFV